MTRRPECSRGHCIHVEGLAPMFCDAYPECTYGSPEPEVTAVPSKGTYRDAAVVPVVVPPTPYYVRVIRRRAKRRERLARRRREDLLNAVNSFATIVSICAFTGVLSAVGWGLIAPFH